MPAIQPMKVEVSMVSLKWSDVLSVMVPGAVTVFALAAWFDRAWALVLKINEVQLSSGVALLFCAAVAGGILDGVTRITWEKWLYRKTPSPNILRKVKPANLPIFEFVVQSSYKYVTFYANLAWAMTILLTTYSLKSPNVQCGVVLVLVAVIGTLLRASWVQWGYYVGHIDGLFNQKRKKES